jgi:hypothetical protein
MHAHLVRGLYTLHYLFRALAAVVRVEGHILDKVGAHQIDLGKIRHISVCMYYPTQVYTRNVSIFREQLHT